MEFLRFGSSIPGAYWGCCAVDIIQNFCYDPDEKASIELVNGDEGCPIMRGGKSLFLGPTWRDIFYSRLRINTFNRRDKPNHAFLCVMTQGQLYSTKGQKWLKILKETGFEFIRAVDNSVYSGDSVIEDFSTYTYGEPDEDYYDEDDGFDGESHPNYLFGLFRNIGHGAIKDPFQPPQQWLDLGEDKTGQEEHKKIWDEIGPAKFFTEEELEAQGVPIWLAGRRSLKPQQLKSARKEDPAGGQKATPLASPFAAIK